MVEWYAIGIFVTNRVNRNTCSELWSLTCKNVPNSVVDMRHALLDRPKTANLPKALQNTFPFMYSLWQHKLIQRVKRLTAALVHTLPPSRRSKDLLVPRDASSGCIPMNVIA